MAAVRTRTTVSETGKSPFAVRIEMDGHELVGDEPPSAGGGGLGPNPFNLMTAALAACTVMTVRWFAAQQGWPVEHVEAIVDHSKKVLVGTRAPTDVFDKTVFIRGPRLTDEQQARLLQVAASCPIQRVLEGAPVISTKVGTPLEETYDQ